MTANIYVPLWAIGVFFIALCFMPDLLKIVKRRRRNRRLLRGTGATVEVSFPASTVRAGGSEDRAA